MMAIDASALLCFMFKELGHKIVAQHIEDSCISAVNLSEVIGRFTRDGHDGHGVLENIRSTSILVVPFDEKQAAIAADLQPLTQPQGLSLGDRSCLSLALTRKIPALTADRAWKSVDLQIEIVSVR